MSDESEQNDITLKKDEEELGAGAELLLPLESLLSAGIHIGTRIKTKDMEPFIYRVRPDGLYVLDVKKTDERIRMAAKFITRFNPSKVVIASSRLYGRTPVEKFCELTQSLHILGRFLPGLFSNPVHSRHIEAEVVIVTDPKADKQAVKEAAMIGIPVIALCDTDNDFINVDFVIPANNKGRRALATMYWLLARQVLRERGELPADTELSISIDDFETKLVEAAEASEGE
ncbi:MAG: small subunit ribosomal protein [Thermoproteota archaeon]|nr:small subunit ribosomal protein [Thermoproteota archaeon]